MNKEKLQLEVVSPTTIKCGHIEWFALDTKLVGKVKKLLKDNERLIEERNDFLDSCIYQDNIINKAIEYIHNHQLVFELSSKKQIQYWFDMFYRELLDILKGEDNESN